MINRLEYADPIIRNILNIEWNIGNTCTYACHYCDPDLHDGSKPWVGFEQTKPFIDRVQEFANQNDKQWIYWQFSGGEPTVYKDFLKLTEYISSKENNVCSVVSNGSRSLRYWETAAPSLMFATLSVHLAYADIEHIRDVADLLTDLDVIVNVHVMMDPERWDEGEIAIDRLSNSRRSEWAIKTGGLTYRTRDFDDLRDQPYPYTEKQLKFLGNGIKRSQIIVRKDFPFPNLRRKMVAIADGQTTDFDAAKAVINDQSRWSGYHCNIGIDRIYIDNDGSLKLGSGCRMDSEGFTGKKFYEDFRFPTNSIICNQERCSCLSDVMVEKFLKIG